MPLYTTPVKINPLLMADEQYCRDILTNQITWFVLSGQGNTQGGYSLPVKTLKDELSQLQYIQDRLRKVYEYALKYPMVRDELNLMLWSEGYNDIAHYINALPLDRLYACGFNTTKMDQEPHLPFGLVWRMRSSNGTLHG